MSDQSNALPKRHCMIVHAYYPLGETRVEREALALVARGYEVDLICLRASNEPAFSNEEGVNVYRLPVRRRMAKGIFGQLLEYLLFALAAFFKLNNLHFQRRYNVIQIHNLPDFLVFSALVPKIMGAKVVLDIHDVMPEFYAARFDAEMSAFPVSLMRWQEQLSCRFADHVITVTEPWRQAIAERGVAAEKISVVMNVADARIFHKTSLEHSRKIAPADMPPKENNRFKLIYHGTLSPRYGIALTIKAMGLLYRDIPDLDFIIHGGGQLWEDELQVLMNLADELGVRERIHFSAEFVPIAELPPLIRKADVGVVSYHRDVFTDGILPTKVMEYIALGMPVIASRSPAMDYYFDDTMIQFFTPEDVDDLARAIRVLYGSPERRAELLQHAEKFNQKYSWAKVSADYVALIDRLRAQ